MTLLMAPLIPPCSAVKAATVRTQTTARTTPYSAIVWPSSFRMLPRTKSNHSAMIIVYFTSLPVGGLPLTDAAVSQELSARTIVRFTDAGIPPTGDSHAIHRFE
jgi:hypothetical protein